MGGLKFTAPAFVSILTFAACGYAFAATDPTGIWINDTGRGAIEIKQCGNSLCGNVVWVKNDADLKGCGKQIIGGVTPAGAGHWDNGWIYSPERGRKYNVELTPLTNGKLRVTGYAGLKFLSKTMIWTRAPEDLKLCTDTVAKAEPPAAASPQNAAEPKPAPAAAEPKTNADVAEKPATVKPDEKSEASPGASAKSADTAKTSKAPDEQAAQKKDPPANAAPDNEGATADNKDSGDADGATKSFKLGNLDLGNVLTRTKSGKCKLDLPWVKVQFDCERD